MRLPKLRKMEPCGGQDKLGMPDLLVFVGVTGIEIRASLVRACVWDRSRMAVGHASSGARGSNSCTKVAVATIIVFSLEA